MPSSMQPMISLKKMASSSLIAQSCQEMRTEDSTELFETDYFGQPALLEPIRSALP